MLGSRVGWIGWAAVGDEAAERFGRVRRALVVSVVLGLGASGCSQAQVGEHSFELSGGYLFVEARVKGRAMSFVFDTGAQGTVLSTRAAGQVGVEATTTGTASSTNGTVRFDVATNVDLELGPFRLPGLAVIVYPLEHLEEALGRRIDGIVGADLFAGRVLEIDYVERKLVLHSRDTMSLEGWGDPCVSSGGSRSPRARVEIELLDEEVIGGEFILDSGAGGYLDLGASLGKRHGLNERMGATFLLPDRSLTDTTQTNEVGHVRRIRLCGWEFPPDTSAGTASEVPVSLSSATAGVLGAGAVGGLVGNQVLKRFDLLLDLRRDRLFLRPNELFDTPIEEDASGLTLVRAPGGPVRVHHVVAGSPGADAGIQIGDHLLRIDGEETGSLTLPEIRARLRSVGESRQLSLERSQRSVAVEVTLARLGEA